MLSGYIYLASRAVGSLPYLPHLLSDTYETYKKEIYFKPKALCS